MITLDEIKKHLLQGKFFRIVFLGDSITSTEWVHPNWREIVEYVLKFKLVEEMDDWKVPEWQIRGYNLAFDGAEHRDLLKLYKSEDFPKDTSVAIFLEGSGVKNRYSEPKAYVKSSKNFIEQILRKSKRLVFCSPLPRNISRLNLQAKPYIDAIRNEQLPKGAMFIDLFDKFKKLDLDKFFTFISSENHPEIGMKVGDLDFIHPNQLGNAHIAKIVLKEVFGVDFDPDAYIKDTLAGEMYPSY